MKEKFNTTAALAVVGFFCALLPQNNLLAQACPGLGSITLTVVAAPEPTLNAPAQLCPGANGTVAVNQTFSTYTWNTGGSGQSIAINNPGTYTVTVSNSAGCTGTVSAQVTAAPTPTPSITQNTYTCNGQITLNAGAGFTTYAWSNGPNAQFSIVNSNGTYTVTVTNAQGCTGTDDFTVTIPTPPSVNISGDLNICTGESTTLNATTGFSTYAWSGGGSSSSLSVSAGGIYTVTVTDAFGCTDTESATVVADQSPVPTVANADICPGGTVTLSVSNAPFQGYAWNTGSSTSTTAANTPGTYTVTVTAANGCTGTTTANVAPLPAPSPNITQNTYTCNGQITLNAGAGFTAYAWSNALNSQFSIVNSSGTYTVTVTNAQGCTGTDEFFANIPAPPVVNVTGDATFCDGASADLSATPGFVSYAWSSGQGGPNITVNVGNTYTVTVTDAFGCTDTDNFSVAELPAPQPLVTGPASICAGETATFGTSVGFPNYSWSNGQTTPSITVGAAGTYTVTVTVANGCTGTDSQTLSLTPAPSPNITPNTYTCNGQITLNAGAGFTTYAWSNGPNAQFSIVNSNGTYTVTVTNAQGCTGTDDFTVTIPAPPVVNVTGDATFCDGASADLNATPGFVSYAWSSGQGGPNITVNVGNTYTVTVTDAFGCTDTDNFSVTELPAPQPVVTGPASICAGETATFGTSVGFPNYSWSNGSSQPSITVGAAGTYTVTVTAANGCTGTDSQTLSLTPAPNPIISEAAYACDNQLTLNAGTGFTAYAWSNGPNAQFSIVNSNDTYTVTVTNAQGCTGTDEFFANIPASPSVSITGDNSFCDGASADLNATPGFVSYAWSSGQGGPNITVTVGNTYTVTVTDAFGCTDTDNFSVTELPAPQPVINGPAQICAGATATFDAGTGFAAYAWAGPNGQTANSQLLTASASGNYTVTVTAANGCTGTDSQTLSLTPAPNPIISEAAYACDNQLTLNAGTGFTAYAWSNGPNAQFSIVNSSGTYTVTVTNAQGCTGTDEFFANIPAPPSVSITGGSTICPGSSTTLASTPGYSSYLWSTASNNPNISVSTAGNYTVTVTDPFGCTASDEFSVSLLAAPAPNISGPSQICATGSATFSVPGTFSAFTWSTGANTPTITVNAANTYTVTVTAVNGCTGTDTQTLTVSTSLQPQITELPYACDGQITLDAGTGFSTYNWNGGQSAQSVTVSVNGIFTVTVSDATGCTGTAIATASIPAAPTVSVSGNNNICAGTATDLNATAGLTAYLWNTGQVGASISASAAGTYTVTATDALGCTVVDDFLLSTVPAPQPQIGGPTVVCTNTSITLDAGAGFAAYAWSNALNSQFSIVNSNGTYTVTVTDATGCTGTDSQTVTEATSILPDLTQLPYACNGTQTLDAGAGFTTYVWAGPNGQTANSQTLTANSPGTYTVTVTSGVGCTGTGTLAVTIPPAPQVFVSGKTTFCQNDTATLTATPGFAAYAWAGPNGYTANSPEPTVNSTGVYTVTVTDALGCTDTESIAVTAQPLPQPQIAGPTICAGQSATFGTSQNFASYAWAGPNGYTANSQQPTANIAGVYTVTVTDANGCTGTDEAELVVNSNPVPTAIALPYACDSQITLDAGTGFSTYAWAGPNGQTANSQQLTASSTGVYTVTVTDANGCTGTATAQANIPTPPQVDITGDTRLCPSETSVLTATAGLVNYVWAGPNGFAANSQQPTVNSPGAYTVTATDNLGCTATNMVLVENATPPTPQISGPAAICNNNPVTLSVAGGNFTQINWSTTEVTASINVGQVGIYTVTVTNADGCTASNSQQVLAGGNVQPGITVFPYQCDQQITLLADTGFATYAWNNGGVLQPITVQQSGTYTVTTTDIVGCTATATVSVNIPAQQQVDITGDNQLCPSEVSTLTATSGFSGYAWAGPNGYTATGQQPTVSVSGAYTVTATDALGCTATATLAVQALTPPVPTIIGPTTICGSNPVSLNVAGGQFADIVWSNAAITPSITVNAAGTYSVTVTDASGCTGTAQSALQPGGNLTASIVQLPYACDGKITLDAGAGFASYAWSNGINAQFSILNSNGIYTVTVTDGGGCSGTATAQVNIPTIVVPQVFSVPSLCPGASITSTVTNQQNFVKFVWNTGETAPFITGVVGGKTYTVTVTDANGCTQTAGFTIALSPTPTPTVTQQPYACDGQITLDAGAGFASYAWSNGFNSQFSILNQSGTYTVTVTNNLACPGTVTTQVVIPPNPVVDITGATSICYGSSTTLTASAGFSAYTWVGPGGFSANSQQPTVTVPGTYTVTVTNAAGCTATTSATLQVGSLIPALQSNEVFCQGTSLTISVSGNYTKYLWSDGSIQPSLTVSQVGVYTVTVTDAAGCTGSATSQVLAVPPASVSIGGGGTICGGNTTTLTASGSVGTFAWSNGAVGSLLTVTQIGTYTVTVTDANGCTATDSETVNAGVPVTATSSRISCRPQEAGTQTLTLTAANGCDSLVNIVTTYQPTKPGLALDTEPVVQAKVGQSVTLDVSANFMVDSVSWVSPFALSCTDCLSPTLTATASGLLQVTAFDPEGCRAVVDLRIAVSKTVDLYVPNVLRPGSTENGFLSVFSGPEIQFVRNFNVYDRWGNALFSRNDMPTNDPSAGWDGTFRNQKMQPGVYVYYFEIELADGSVEVRKGDVTVVE